MPADELVTHAAGVTRLDLKASSYELLEGALFQLAGECYMVLLTFRHQTVQVNQG